MTITNAKQLEAILSDVDRVTQRFNRRAKHDIHDDFNLSQYRVLALVTAKPQQLNAITAKRGITQQGTGKVLKLLKSHGFVKITYKKDNKRAKSITITAAGKEAMTKSIRIIKEVLKKGDL